MSGSTKPSHHRIIEHTPYLALGDSIAFGSVLFARQGYADAAKFTGYPTFLANALHLTLTNASCPGQTSSGFVSGTGQSDDGCAYRSDYPLHVKYPGTQLAFAERFLTDHPDTSLVTLGIGINDLELMRTGCKFASACESSELPAVLARIKRNLQAILEGLRTAGYRGSIVVANYYSYDGPTESGTTEIEALNNVIKSVTAAKGDVDGDVFSTFEKLAGGNGEALCGLGLLHVFPGTDGKCDYHPSRIGQRAIASSIGSALVAADVEEVVREAGGLIAKLL